jgi:hypothetical protein
LNLIEQCARLARTLRRFLLGQADQLLDHPRRHPLADERHADARVGADVQGIDVGVVLAGNLTSRLQHHPPAGGALNRDQDRADRHLTLRR